MTYARLLIPVDPSPQSVDRVALAVGLAERFQARLIGVAARETDLQAYADITVPDERLLRAEEKRIEEELSQAEALFRKAAGDRDDVEWRGSIAWPTNFVVEQARAADLIVVGRQGPADQQDWRFGVSPGDVLMSAGRPILVVPPRMRHLSGRRAVVAWKDTREARRAVWDALPLLRSADQIVLFSVGESSSHALSDVAAFLSRHGASAVTDFQSGSDMTVAAEVLRLVHREGADLIVAGGYGHSRVREWIFGGVTRELLAHTPVCCLLSH